MQLPKTRVLAPEGGRALRLTAAAVNNHHHTLLNRTTMLAEGLLSNQVAARMAAREAQMAKIQEMGVKMEVMVEVGDPTSTTGLALHSSLTGLAKEVL